VNVRVNVNVNVPGKKLPFLGRFTWYGGRSSFTVLRHYMVYTFDMLFPAGGGRVYAMEEGDSGRPKRKVYPEG